MIVERRVWHKFAVIFDPHEDAKAPASSPSEHDSDARTCTSVVNGVLTRICVLPMRDVAGKSVYVKVKNGKRGRRNGGRG